MTTSDFRLPDVPLFAAFDLGTNMAVAWRNRMRGPVVWSSCVLTGKTRAAKLAACRDWVRLWWFDRDRETRLRMHAVFFERPFARGQAATRMLWGIAGHLEACADNFGLPVVDMPPATIKKFCAGSGKAGKEMMLETARRWGYTGDNEHEADAVCALVYAEHHIEKDLHHAKAE